MAMQKLCPSCKTTKPETDFARRRSGRIGHLASYCKTCSADHNRKRRKLDPDRARKIERASKLKGAFGISILEYESILSSQNGVCAICKSASPDRFHKNLSVDHCHKTGVVRGLLCTNCNTGLGRFKDDTKLLEAAITYLGGNK